MKTPLHINILTILTLFVNSIIGQPAYPPPTGVYCSCGPTTGSGNGSVDPAVAVKSFVKGILVRVSWKNIETADNVYNWSLIDGQIAAAQSYGKKISLAIGSGINAPSWLYSIGTQTMSFAVPFSGTLPILWDTTYLNKWTEFIRALGNKYKNDTTIRLVYFTNSTTNGYEMQLPNNPTPNYTTLGYTDAKVIGSWKRVIDTFNLAFPNHYLSNDFHPVNGSNAPADSIYAYAKLKLGIRYGANAWWFTQNNTTVYPSQYTILQNSASTNVFTGVQMAYNATADSALFGSGGLHSALALAISKNICYWEVWNQDILNPNLSSLLTNSTTCSTVTGIIGLNNKADNTALIYPNPSTGIITLSLKNNAFQMLEIKILDLLGKLVYVQTSSDSDSSTIDLSHLHSGIYFIHVSTNGYNEVYREKIVITTSQ